MIVMPDLVSDAIGVVEGLAIAYMAILAIGLTGYILYRPKREGVKASSFEIVVVSKADERVRKSLFETVRYHARRFGGVTLVVDEESPLLPELRRLGHVKLVVVPRWYRRDLVGKGRALNYFIENYVDREKWYVFIDDDNIILDDNFLYEIPYYESRGVFVGNGVLVPRMGRSKLAYVMDWVRFLDDVTLYRFFTGLLGRPLLGLHGELLIVKGRVLKEVGFSYRSITEDFRFSVELVKRGYRTWQSSTRVLIKSPNSIADLIKQRGRWFKGVISDVKHSPLPMKLVVGFRAFFWSLVFTASWAMLPAVLAAGIFWFILPAGLYYASAYLYGSYKAGEPVLVFTIPLFGLIEASARIYGLLAVKDFIVIDKN
ncbi:egghead-like protein [Thermogladius calderae 1633]|uniref:Egghead-like protein n=2 Tax=Thermogladius calderae TaxID=1200300 RepID=I3TFY9_THEC1|nr:egghead-like protein [Thermogladius calderae 1633]